MGSLSCFCVAYFVHVYLPTRFFPQFSLFAYTGPNVSHEIVLLDVSPFTSNPNPDPTKYTESINKKYSIRPGFQLGAGLEWHYDENLSATVEVNYLRSAYRKTTTNFFFSFFSSKKFF